MLINSKTALGKIKNNKALCAFNFSTIETAESIVKIAAFLKSTFILQTSEGEAIFLNPEIAQAIASHLSKKYHQPFSLNLDHGKNLKLIEKCINCGYTSIHFDGSNLSLKENIKLTKTVVELCKPKKISVEGEIGQISGSSSLTKSHQEESLTNPNEAVQFIKETGVDSLAVSIGEKHGLGKPNLHFNLLKKIASLVKIPLVLHGGSGISAKDLNQAILLGIRKVNFNTELRLAWTQSLKNYFKHHPQEIVPYKILSAVDRRVSQIAKQKITICTL